MKRKKALMKNLVGLTFLDKKGKSGKVQVAFTLHKDGSITDATIQNASGDDALDQAALRAVKDCRRAPLPSAFARETVKMRFLFYYNPKDLP